MKVYVPDLENYKCFVVRNETTIRAYKEIPQNNRTIDYRDYYYNSNYLYQDGSQQFSQYTTLPTCLENSVITDNIYYRNDIFEILILLFLLLFIAYFLIKTCLKALFFGWR